MNSDYISLKPFILKFIKSIKKPIVFIYNLYCLAIYAKYNYAILVSISNSNSPNDKINTILYFSVFISSILLLSNESDRLGFKLFFNNNYFCLINLMWLLYIIFKIVYFGVIESLSAIKEKSFNYSIWDITYSIGSYFIFGGYYLFYQLYNLTISAASYYLEDKKLLLFIQFLDNHFKEKNLDYIYLYAVILVINACILLLIIVLNILFNVLYIIHKNIFDVSKDIKEKKV